MGRSTEFRRELDRALDARTRWLRAVLDNPDLEPTDRLPRDKVHKIVFHMQRLASQALSSRLTHREFRAHTEPVLRWRVTAGKGRGPDQKKAAFKAWYRQTVRRSNCIYVFRSGNRAVYVGKTTIGASRPASHFSQHWFSGITHVDLHPVRGTRPLPALECLAIHKFEPSRNKVAAETRKWTSKCPLCEIHEEIDEQLRDIVR
ncbi:MAG: hypothetical protein V4510_10635 [bacterium]